MLINKTTSGCYLGFDRSQWGSVLTLYNFATVFTLSCDQFELTLQFREFISCKQIQLLFSLCSVGC